MFYVVQLDPLYAPHRIKLGWAWDALKRLQRHRTAAPQARLLAFWRCPRNEERTTRLRLTAVGCRRVSNEVFDVENLRAFCEPFIDRMLRHSLNESELPLPFFWAD